NQLAAQLMLATGVAAWIIFGVAFVVFLRRPATLHLLLSFPTRRSSDLSRVVFYDYDEIEYLTDCNFRRIPLPPTPEDELSDIRRSEEHTLNSSHSQISYAVFCLKKKSRFCRRLAAPCDVRSEALAGSRC